MEMLLRIDAMTVHGQDLLSRSAVVDFAWKPILPSGRHQAQF